MKTITKRIKVYNHKDLLKNDNVRQNVIYNYHNNTDHIWQDVLNSIEALQKHLTFRFFGFEEYLSFDDPSQGVTGLRLRTWLINNFTFLWKRTYIKRIDKHIKHRMSKCVTNSIGKQYSVITSNIQLENCCVLTGVCYDDSLLKPIYDFIAKPDNTTDMDDLIRQCFSSLQKDYDSELEYLSSEEGIMEDIAANGYQFTEDGKMY